MKFRMLALLLLAGSTAVYAGTRFSIGVHIGNPPPPMVMYGPPPAPYSTYVPRSPGYGYLWVPGYWYPAGPRYVWREGYWTRPPHGRGRWIAPHYRGRHYYPGYWR